MMAPSVQPAGAHPLGTGPHFLFQVGPFSLALEMQAVSGVCPLDHATQEGANEADSYVLGTVLFRKEEVPLVSLRHRFGLPPSDRTAFAVVLHCHGAEVAVGADALVDSESIAGARLRPLPGRLSELEPGLLKGWLTAGHIGAYLVDAQVLFTQEDLERIGEVLLG